MDPLQDPCLRIHVTAFLYLRLLCKIHVSGSVNKHPCVSQDPLQDPCLRIHVSASICISGTSARSSGSVYKHPYVSQDPLQDPCPDPCLSSHMYLRILHKIHVFGFMSQHLCISRILCKIHVFGFMSQHLRISRSSARSMCPIHVLAFMSQHLCISRILCKIHVSGFMSQHPFISQHPLQDPCLRSHVSASLYLRILCKIHVSGSMSQHLYISGASARSMSPIHVLASLSSDFVACAGETQILTSGDAFCVALRREKSPAEIRGSVSRRRNANFDLPRRIFCGPAQAKRKFNLPRRVLCPYQVDSRGGTTR